jgi:signal transduction histidine kinase
MVARSWTARVSQLVRQIANDVRLADGVIAVALSVMAQAQLPLATSWWLRAAMLVVTGAVAARRQSALGVTAIVAAGVALMGFGANPPSVFGEYLAVMLAAFTVAERCSLVAAGCGGLLLAAGVVGHDWNSPEYGTAAGIASDLTIPAVIWVLGRVVHFQRGRADGSRRLVRQLERDREELARNAVAAERAHLARELHDVVTHSVSVVVIQAQGAQRVLTGHPEVAGALETIEAAGRTALTEMRRLLGLLRDTDEQPARTPQPGLADLSRLTEQVRDAGLPVTLMITGTSSDLDSGLQLSAYRIVQEALTNALKYAGPAQATVVIDVRPDAVQITVNDDGAGTEGADGTGRGLLGMRERVAVYGGSFDAGPRPDGPGFHVHAHLPTEVTV